MTRRSSLVHNPSSWPVLLAALWPLSVYTQVPLTGVRLGTVAAIVTAALALQYGRRQRSYRPPFEYWWPGALAVVLATAPVLSGGQIRWPVLAGVVFFLGGVTLVKGRIAAAHGCLALAWAGAASALLHAAAQAGLAPPTAFDPGYTLAVSGPQSAATGMLLVFHSLLAGVFAAVHPGLSKACRLASLAATAVSGAWLVYIAPWIPELAAPWTSRVLLATPMPDGILVLLGLWLVARVAARAYLRPAMPGCAGRTWIPALVLAGSVAALGCGADPDPGSFLLLGLFAAHSAPWSTEDRGPALRHVLVPAIGCVLIQASGLLPLSTADPRNQAARAEENLAAQDWTALDGALDFLLARSPAHPIYTLLSAESLAAQGWLDAAAAHYCRANYPAVDHPIAGISIAAHRKAFLDTLRDQVSRLPEGNRGLFFERALVHAGESENALNFLALHRQKPADAATTVDSAILAAALARLLGDSALSANLESLDTSALTGYYLEAGVRVEHLPGGFPSIPGPLLLRAVSSPEAVMVDIWAGSDLAAVEETSIEQIPAVARQGGIGAVTWQSWRQTPDGGWAIELASPLLAVAAVAVDGDGSLVVSGTGRGAAGSGPASVVLYIP